MVERRCRRQSSNVFQMFTKTQRNEIREAFNLMDRDADSKISVADLTSFLESIGSPYTDEEIAEMVKELEPNPNYLSLLSLIGEKMTNVSSEKELYNAFRLFDEENKGFIENSVFRKWMTEKGDPISKEYYDYLVKGCVEDGKLNYKDLILKMRHGEIISKDVE